MRNQRRTIAHKMMTDKDQTPQEGLSVSGCDIYRQALIDSLIKLNPLWMARNPVMFVVEVGSVLTTALWIQALFGFTERPAPISSEASPSGSGLQYYSPIFPKRWPRGRARPRRPPCAWPARRQQAKKLRHPKHGSHFDVVPSSDLRTGRLFSW